VKEEKLRCPWGSKLEVEMQISRTLHTWHLKGPNHREIIQAFFWNDMHCSMEKERQQQNEKKTIHDCPE
jgi:hypothetical protein